MCFPFFLLKQRSGNCALKKEGIPRSKTNRDYKSCQTRNMKKKVVFCYLKKKEQSFCCLLKKQGRELSFLGIFVPFILTNKKKL